MKYFYLSLLILTNFSLFAQFGVEISPAYHSQRITTVPSLPTYINGYGYSLGITYKTELSDMVFFRSGLNYEWFAFDSRYNGQLVSSLRMNSADIPLAFHTPTTFLNLDVVYGLGANYIFSSKVLSNNLWSKSLDISNHFQPYILLGLANRSFTSSEQYEIGVSARYRLLKLYNTSDNKTNLFTFNFHLRYYFND